MSSDQAVQAHNDARHNAQGGGRPDLTWDNGLANDAQGYAQQLANTQTFQHSGVDGQGENLFMSSGDASFVDASNAWIGEQPNYHGENIADGNFEGYGHYTQVIWPSTTSVGIGSAKASNGATYIVGRYSPPGNFVGQTAWAPGPSGASSGGNGGSSQTYTVAAGDSMYSISQQLGVSLDALEAANPQVTGPDYVIQAGQTLNVPAGGGQRKFMKTHPIVHPNA